MMQKIVQHFSWEKASFWKAGFVCFCSILATAFALAYHFSHELNFKRAVYSSSAPFVSFYRPSIKNAGRRYGSDTLKIIFDKDTTWFADCLGLYDSLCNEKNGNKSILFKDANIHFIPRYVNSFNGGFISALESKNLTIKNERLRWFHGQLIVQYLIEVAVIIYFLIHVLTSATQCYRT